MELHALSAVRRILDTDDEEGDSALASIASATGTADNPATAPETMLAKTALFE